MNKAKGINTDAAFLPTPNERGAAATSNITTTTATGAAQPELTPRAPSKSERTERHLKELRERREAERQAAEMAENGKSKPPSFFSVFGDDHRAIEKGLQQFIYERDLTKEFTNALAQRAKVRSDG